MIKKYPSPNYDRLRRFAGNEFGATQDQKLAKRLVVNDVQSQLNPTRVLRIIRPKSVDQIAQAIRQARLTNAAISIAGGRNAMGGQQFGKNTIHLDLTNFNGVLELDLEKGLVSVEPGIQWPELISKLHSLQPVPQGADDQPWTIRQKQTGVDRVTIGGSLAANIHGRGLKTPPFVADIESFQILDSSGELLNCSRRENSELFSLVIGGYGLFGIVTRVTLRLVRRFKVKRLVDRIVVRDLGERIQHQLDTGCVFGDCQYAIDLDGAPQDHEGIMPCYQPVDFAVPVSHKPVALEPGDWAELYRLTRTDKRRAFEIYAQHYLRTDGQVYWSDTHQLSGAFAGHKLAVDPRAGTEMISEICIEDDKAMSFLSSVRAELARRQADITYGTIRFIEPDRETFLPWAQSRSVCIVVNLHIPRSRSGIQKAKEDFRAILNHAVDFGGTFYLTYHRWAEARHVIAAYPQMPDFFKLKRKYDPTEIFQSDWYRHYHHHFGGRCCDSYTN